MLLATGRDSNGDVMFPADGDECWTFPMVFGKSDMEVMCLAWGLDSYASAVEICGWCLANRNTLPHTDCRHNAAWRANSPLPNEIFMARLAARSQHPISKAHYFNKYFPRLDTLHVWDTHGIMAVVAANLIHKLTRTEDRLVRTVDARLASVNAELDQYYHDNKIRHRLPPLRDTNPLAGNGWATLNGKVIKAAPARNLHGFLPELASRYCDAKPPHPTADEHSSINKLCQSLDEFYSTLYSAGMFLNEAEHGKMEVAVGRVGRHLQKLRGIALAANKLYWQITPKTHYGQHWPEQCRLLNPCFTQTYADESIVGRLAKIWEGSCNGPFTNSQQGVVCNKYLS